MNRLEEKRLEDEKVRQQNRSVGRMRFASALCAAGEEIVIVLPRAAKSKRGKSRYMAGAIRLEAKRVEP